MKRIPVTRAGVKIGEISKCEDSPLEMWHAYLLLPVKKCIGGAIGKLRAKQMVRQAHDNEKANPITYASGLHPTE